MPSRKQALGVWKETKALFYNLAVFAMADAIPAPPKHHGGKKRMYPNYIFIVWGAALHIHRSSRQVEGNWAEDDLIWPALRREARAAFPADPSRWLPKAPPRRHHWKYMRRTYFSDPELLERLRTIFEEHSACQTIELGFFRRLPGYSVVNPHPDNVIYGDGTYYSARSKYRAGDTYVDPHTGIARPRRRDMDAHQGRGGDGRPFFGSVHATLEVRGQGELNRFILSTTPVTPKDRKKALDEGAGPAREEPSGEAAVSVAMLHRILPRLPQVDGFAYDRALSWHLLDRVMKAGVPTYVRVIRQPGELSAGDNPVQIERAVRVVGGTRSSIDVYAANGYAGAIAGRTVRGAEVFVPFEMDRFYSRGETPGNIRWYGEFFVPDSLGGGRLRIRMDTTKEDRRAGVYRSHYLRLNPEGTAAWHQVAGRRADAESTNSDLKNRMHGGKAYSFGRTAQGFDALFFALFNNSRALAVARKAALARAG